MAKAKPKPTTARTKKRSTTTTPAQAAATRDPNIEWTKNHDWTWTLVSYLADHPSFRQKLFSDSTADANKENRPKAVAKEGKQQQYGVLAKHVFEEDPNEGERYKKKPSRFVTSVETRLRRLKKEYQGYLAKLGSTGAGLDPSEVTDGSAMANLVDEIVAEWPWWKEFHAFWRELPNYNPIGVTSSTPGVDHAANAAQLFDPLPPDDTEEADGQAENDARDKESDAEEEADAEDGKEHEEKEDGKEDDEKEDMASEHAFDDWEPTPPPEPRLPRPAPPPAKIAAIPSKAAKPAVGGRDSGLAKAHAAAAVSRSSSGNGKSAIKEFTAAREAEAERIHRKREMAHELAMANSHNKRLKYEAKLKTAALEQKSKMDELKLRLEIAKLEAAAVAARGITAVAPAAVVPIPAHDVSLPAPIPAHDVSLPAPIPVQDVSLPAGVPIPVQDVSLPATPAPAFAVSHNPLGRPFNYNSASHISVNPFNISSASSSAIQGNSSSSPSYINSVNLGNSSPLYMYDI